MKHGSGEQGSCEGNPPVVLANPDEIVISDEDVDESNIATEVALMSDVRPTASQNPDEITLVDEEELVEPLAVPRSVVPQSETKFIALDKCLPRRAFLEVFFVVV